MTKEFICIICPRSCNLTVTLDEVPGTDTEHADTSVSQQQSGNSLPETQEQSGYSPSKALAQNGNLLPEAQKHRKKSPPETQTQSGNLLTELPQHTGTAIPRIRVSGNRCKRGAEYGKQEALCPMRMLTTTVTCLVTAPTETRTSGTVQQDNAEPKQKSSLAHQPSTTVHPAPQSASKKASAAGSLFTAATRGTIGIQAPLHVRLPVKTGCEIPLTELQPVIAQLRTITATAPIKCGDILTYIALRNKTTVPIIACTDIAAPEEAQL